MGKPAAKPPAVIDDTMALDVVRALVSSGFNVLLDFIREDGEPVCRCIINSNRWEERVITDYLPVGEAIPKAARRVWVLERELERANGAHAEEDGE